MPHHLHIDAVLSSAMFTQQGAWCTFEDILRRLHTEGIYIHSEQLAEFLLFHGLPVNLCYVPPHLRQKAAQINEHYQGDMAQLVEDYEYEQPC